MVSSKSNWRRK